MSLRVIILLVAVAIFKVSAGQDVASSRVDTAQTSQVVAQLPNAPEKNFHRFMLSFGKSFPMGSSAKYLACVSMPVRAYKNVFVGLNIESISRIWKRELEADTISGSCIELSALAFSDPLYRKKRVGIGLWGDAGAGILASTRSLGLPGGFNYYDEFKEKQYYVRLEGGVYCKYRGIILTLGCFVNDLDLSRYKGRKVTGIFRKPTEYGLNLSLRFSMW